MPGNKSEVQLSKQLSWLLRHGAQGVGLPLQADGFVPVASILQHPRYNRVYNLEILEHLVACDKKCRFTLRQNRITGEYEIRANQGHSLAAVRADECLKKITSASEVPLAVHGTYYRYWDSIRREGLRRMHRNHVHFATSDQLMAPNDGTDTGVAISGYRHDCEILIYLDVNKAIAQGKMILYRSDNNVILCSGIDGENYIPTEYFAKVIDKRTGKALKL